MENPSFLDKVLETAKTVGLGYLDYRLADKQAEAGAVLDQQQRSEAQQVYEQSTWGIGGVNTQTLGLPQWVLPAAALCFVGVVTWKVVSK